MNDNRSFKNDIPTSLKFIEPSTIRPRGVVGFIRKLDATQIPIQVLSDVSCYCHLTLHAIEPKLSSLKLCH